MPGFEDKRIYVWYDAVIGYLSASKEWAAITGAPDAWRAWWQGAGARTYHFIGKDNIEFHTIIWPGMLIGYDRSLNLPYDVPSNEYLNVEGRKLSKSRRWMIGMGDALDRYDPDPWRYALAASVPEAQDVNFTWEEFVRRNNEELVATWGNLANRVLGFAYKRFDGKVPEPGAFDAADRALLDQIGPTFERVTALLEGVKLKQALTETMALAHEANRYLNAKEPWHQIKTDPAAAATSIFVALRVIDNLKTLFAPFLPFTSQQLHDYLGYDGVLFGRLYTEELAETERRHLALRYDGAGAIVSWQPSELAPGQALRPAAGALPQVGAERGGCRGRTDDSPASEIAQWSKAATFAVLRNTSSADATGPREPRGPVAILDTPPWKRPQPAPDPSVNSGQAFGGGIGFPPGLGAGDAFPAAQRHIVRRTSSRYIQLRPSAPVLLLYTSKYTTTSCPRYALRSKLARRQACSFSATRSRTWSRL